MGGIIGIIPAAGRGVRAQLPYPKELLPVKAENGRIITVIEGAIQQLANADIGEAIIVLRPEKQMIADYLGNHRFGVNLVYTYQQTMNSREGLPDAVLAGRITQDDLYVMLMGDVYFTFPYVVRHLVQDMPIGAKFDWIASVATWYTEEPQRFGIVQHEDRLITSVQDKPQSLSGLHEHWGAVAFTSAFWKYLEVERDTFSNTLHVAAQDERISTLLMPRSYLDFGTPEAIIDNIKVANS